MPCAMTWSFTSCTRRKHTKNILKTVSSKFSKKVLVACEESQAVTIALRKKGVDAFSCDIQECSGGHPEWHIKGDVFDVFYSSGPWSGVIAFPPCTHLAASGARHFPQKRMDGRQNQAIDFFMETTRLPVGLLAIENPIGIMSHHYRKPDQIIQPWQFGHGEVKSTCLWVRGLPPLAPTIYHSGRSNRLYLLPPSPDRAKIRSKTYAGIASAMADQWSPYFQGHEKQLTQLQLFA